MFTITGTVGDDGKYLVTGEAVDTTVNTVLKFAFENNTSGTSLSLCAGSETDFEAGNTAKLLSKSGGPGSKFLTITDTNALAGKKIYVLREAGSAASEFTLTVD
jgi:hypothetical protein